VGSSLNGRGHRALFVIALVALGLLAVVPFAQAKFVSGTFGPNGTQGGQVNGGIQLTINNSGAGGVPAGTVYVADILNNRVQRLGPTGNFERAWGFDVDSSNPSTGFEICTVAANCKLGTTTATTANGGQLNGPRGIGVNQTTGHVYVNESNNRRVSEFDADGNFIRTWGADVLIGGVTTFEVCSVASACKTAAAAGTDGGRFGATLFPLQIDSSGNVWIGDSGNRRLQKFDSSGNFVAVYGYGVNGGTALESCTSTAAGVCKASPVGTGEGQLGSGLNAFAIDPAGNLFVADVGNQRLIKFNAAMTSATTFATVPGLFSTGAVLVLPSGNVLAVPSQGSERVLLELDTSGNPVETSLAGIGLTAINSLARNAATGRIYLTITSNATTFAKAAILILDATDSSPPQGTIDPVTTKTATTASLSGTVDPQGSTISGCSFQYSTSETFATGVFAATIANCSSLTPGGGPQAVSTTATGLTPNTNYFVRLAIDRLYVADPAVSTAQSFTTDTVAPAVSNVGAINPGDTSARVVATIDPRNSGDLEYVFQYGTTPALGFQTDPVELEDGNSPVIVSQVLDGLSPSTQYYVRAVATNATGSTQSATATFTTRANPLPSPPGRAYEMVSPPYKNGGAALSGIGVSTVAPGGDAIAFCTSSIFGDPPGPQSFLCVDYVSHRTSSGWQTRSTTPRYCRIAFGQPGLESSSYFFYNQRVDFSQNLDQATLGQPEGDGPLCSVSPLDPAAPLPQRNLYRESLTGDPGYQLLTPVLKPTKSGIGGGAAGGAEYMGSSDDFGHIVYLSTGKQTPDAAAPTNTLTQIFEWDHGTLRLVSKDLAGNAFTTRSEVVTDGISATSDGINGVSADGDRIFFRNASLGDSEVYVRKGGTTTQHVSQSECTSSCGSSAADEFLFASPSGSKAFFRSDAKLTDDTPASTASFDPTSEVNANLYMYTDSAAPASDPNNLTLLSKDNEPADGVNPDVTDVLGVSDDGNIAYFAANGQIVPGGPTGTGNKVYRWSWNGGSPTVDYLVGGVPAQNWVLQASERLLNRLVTPDGKYLTLEMGQRLDPLADTDSDDDIYRWDAAGGWVCASCQAPGVASAGDSTFQYDQLGMTFDAPRSSQRRIVMSDDGQRVFFESLDALVPEDVNGQVDCPDPNEKFPGGRQAHLCKDVYEWHDGTISMLTTGTAREPIPVAFLGASADGRDAFVYTAQRLVGWDSDEAGDIYDARVGGGFPEPPPTGAPCEGEACRGPVSPPPANTGAGTGVFQGAGNPTPKRPKHKKKAKHHKKKAKHHKKKKQANRGSQTRNSDNRRAGK
jgi:sugar lactone lactonase YvrE